MKKTAKKTAKRAARRKPAMRQLVIDRARWLRGEGYEDSYLLRSEDETMCCLGFFALACGLGRAGLSDVKEPLDLTSRRRTVWSKKAPWLFDGDSDIGRLMSSNDNAGIKAHTRERRIAKIFAKHGWRVKFVGRTFSVRHRRNVMRTARDSSATGRG